MQHSDASSEVEHVLFKDIQCFFSSTNALSCTTQTMCFEEGLGLEQVKFGRCKRIDFIAHNVLNKGLKFSAGLHQTLSTFSGCCNCRLCISKVTLAQLRVHDEFVLLRFALRHSTSPPRWNPNRSGCRKWPQPVAFRGWQKDPSHPLQGR